eukprot:scaffold2262_cov107-Skeletonema_dohrnii-CCMP3373.AAC.14
MNDNPQPPQLSRNSGEVSEPPGEGAVVVDDDGSGGGGDNNFDGGGGGCQYSSLSAFQITTRCLPTTTTSQDNEDWVNAEGMGTAWDSSDGQLRRAAAILNGLRHYALNELSIELP